MASYSRKTEYSISYPEFIGIDLSHSAENLDRRRCCDVSNMYRDYYGSDGSALETVPGFRRLYSFFDDRESRKINSLVPFAPYWDKFSYIAVHAGSRLFLYPLYLKKENYAPAIAPIQAYSETDIHEAAVLNDQKSKLFEHEGKLFVLDGKNYMVLEQNGLRSVEELAYVPTIYRNGERYEQKNLLTDKFFCEFDLSQAISSLNEHSHASCELIFRITGEASCEVAGVSDPDVEELFIPSSAEIDGVIYKVERVAEYSLKSLHSLRRVVVADGVTEIGNCAFMLCSALREVSMTDSIERIGSSAFYYCSALNTVYLSGKITELPRNAFGETNISTVHYSGDAEQWNEIIIDSTNAYLKNSSHKVFESSAKTGAFCFYINEPCSQLYSVTLDGAPVSNDKRSDLFFESVYEEINGVRVVSAIILHAKDSTQLYGKTLRFFAQATKIQSKVRGDSVPFDQLYESGFDIIAECTLCESFDGRYFFSGNKKYPSAVFYTARNLAGKNDPTYIGVLNYFNVGNDNSRISSMTASSDKLTVIKGGRGNGGVYIYSGESTGEDLIVRRYVLCDSASGVGGVGDSCLFFGDTVFLSERGLDAVVDKPLYAQSATAHRSSNIDSELLQCKLDDARMCVWQGYLVLLCGEKIFLADSRRTFTHDTGERQYEWYALSGIGTYQDQFTAFFKTRLREEWQDLYVKHGGSYFPLEEGDDDGICDTVYQSEGYRLSGEEAGGVGNNFYYCTQTDADGILHCYICDSCGEMTGGVFYPAVSALCLDDVLYFGTENGSLCCFNTDLRDEHGHIDRKHYTFDGRRYFSGFGTKSDNCGIPSLTKSTVKHSLCLHMKSFGSGRVKILVRTDNDKWKQIADSHNGVFSFDDTEFDRFSFNTSERTALVIPEKEKRWTEKQYHIYSDEYMRPFGIFDLSYRFRVAGRIKEK